MARLDRMEGDREVAQLAAVLGREFSYELLAAVATVDEPTLQAELAKLVQAEILYPKGRPPRCTYIFKHALLRRRAVQRAGQGQAAAVPPADRRGAGSPVPADRRDAAGAARPPLHRGGPDREGDRLLAQGGAAVAGAIGGERSDRPSDQRPRAAGNAGRVARARRAEVENCSPRWAPPTSRPRLCRARSRAGLAPGARAVPADRGCSPSCSRSCWASGSGTSCAAICGCASDLAAEGMELAERLNDPGMLMEALFMPGVTMFYRADFAGCPRLLREGGGRLRRP